MIYAILGLAFLGGFFGVVLAFAGKHFEIEVDSQVEQIEQILPGSNCGNCGYPSCNSYAHAIVFANAPIDCCLPGKIEVRNKIVEITGRKTEDKNQVEMVAELLCQGDKEKAVLLYHYEGLQDCRAAVNFFNGPKACLYGCIGLGTCSKVCPGGAITMESNGLPRINTSLCTGCGVCIQACPQKVLTLVEKNQEVLIRCKNMDNGKQAKEVCQTACISCGLCEKNCPVSAISMLTDNTGSIAVIDSSKCVNCGVCIEKCPTKAITQRNNQTLLKDLKKDIAIQIPCAHCGLCQEK